MGFDKAYFENFSHEMDCYLKVFPAGWITVTIKLIDGRELNVNRIIKIEGDRIMLAYYDPKKQRKLPKRVRATHAEPNALPAIVISYSSVLWVEFNPGTVAGTSATGFRAQTNAD